MTIRTPVVKEGPYWEAFAIWAEDNGVSLEHEDDWMIFWDCFVKGAETFPQVANMIADLRSKS